MYQIPLTLEELIRNKDWEGIKSLAVSKIPIAVAAILILILGFMVANFIGKLVVKGLRLKGVDPSIHSFIKTMVTFSLKVVVVLTALSTLGVNVNSFIAAIAAGGVAAGLGLQSSVSQFASGMLILINHPFKSGDFVDLGSVSGKVKEIKIMYTVLITPDNKRVIVPNSTITSANIINFNAEEKLRVNLKFNISYDQDIDKARDSIKSVVRRNEMIFTDPEPVIAVNEHGASSICLACYVWCSPTDYWTVYFYMQEQVKKEFDSQNISIPYDQLDVHIKNS